MKVLYNMLNSLLAAIGIGPSITIFVALVAAVLLFFLYVVNSKTAVNLSFGPIKVILGNKSFVNLAGLIATILDYQERHIRSIFTIENDLIRKMLNYTEQKLLELKYVLSESYSEILASKLDNIEDVRLHRDYRFYQRTLNVLVKELKDNIFYDAYLQNHFELMEGAVWERYKKDKTHYVINFISDFQDSVSEDSRLVSRRETNESEKHSVPKIEEIVKEIFEICREYSMNSKREIEQARLKSKEDVKSICKNVYGIEI